MGVIKNIFKNTFKTRESYYIVAILVIGSIFLLKYNIDINNKEKENIILKKEIISKDKLVKIGEGKYSKLVNYYNSNSDLLNQLKKENKLLYDTIKARGEKPLSNTGFSIGFKPKDTITEISVISDTVFKFSSYYPKEENYFIKYDGNVNTKTKLIKENWSFNKMKISVVLTEKENGLWDTYIDAPEFANISDVKINSLPPKEFTPKTDRPKTFGLYGGGGIRTNLDNIGSKSLVLKGGLSVKDKIIITGDFGTDKTVGAGILIKL